MAKINKLFIVDDGSKNKMNKIYFRGKFHQKESINFLKLFFFNFFATFFAEKKNPLMVADFKRQLPQKQRFNGFKDLSFKDIYWFQILNELYVNLKK